MMRPSIVRCTIVTAMGSGLDATLSALREGRGGLAPTRFLDADLPSWSGIVAGLDDVTVPPGLARFDCRSNRLLELALAHDGIEQAIAAERRVHGAERIGVYVGTSGAGILDVELAYRRRDAEGRLPRDVRYEGTMNLFSPAAYLVERLGLAGPAVVISAACASSAKAFAAAARGLATGLCDAALVGAVEAMCLTTLYGFNSLGLLSSGACRPCDAARDGISLGEAGGFVLMRRAPDERGFVLEGYGESSDAHHLSTPHPEGRGAAQAMRAALAMAGADGIDYVNLHGTGTRTNDAAEDRAVNAVLGVEVPRSSTKGWTGHTLGAAGLVEAVVTLLAMEHGFLPGTLNCANVDPEIVGNVLLRGRASPVRRAVSNSFGFGGSNCSLVFGNVGR